MNRYDALTTRLQAGETVMIDGGTGTECERRGIPQLENAWNGGGALSHPDVVRVIHKDYLEHGAEVIISNTFATSLHALEAAGESDRFDDYNRVAVELAIEARDACTRPAALVAGGISYWSWTGDHPPLSEIEASVGQQAAVMRDAGADLLMLEMMIDIDRMLTTLAAAQTSGLPVWVGISCAPNGEGVMALCNGEPLVDALAALAGLRWVATPASKTRMTSIRATKPRRATGAQACLLSGWLPSSAVAFSVCAVPRLR